ncbi:NTPase KAP family P-loop domain-containing protein 1 [Hyperolius riggenbachi]|uniref:NTPase KAP family P-loop domain-containing protein 1 n=1 Tax=Hyperolius riggenbachi TaxID=752182 RepID=UPI0035A33FD3
MAAEHDTLPSETGLQGNKVGGDAGSDVSGADAGTRKSSPRASCNFLCKQEVALRDRKTSSEKEISLGCDMTWSGKETEDDIYCACLSKALCQVATPVTVGLYAPFGGRVYMLLDRITKCMREEALRITEKEEKSSGKPPVTPEGCGFIQLLWRLLFYCPVITARHLERKSIQFIFVHFSAWQYAGSDRLWAGLVTTLCDQMRRHFGILPLSLFNVLGSTPKRNLEENVKEWMFKRTFCIILVVVIILLIIGLLLLVVPISHKTHGGEEKVTTVFGSLATVVAGSTIALTLFKLCKSVLISQKQKIERLVNSEKFSSQMGFMNEVKKEVELISQMVQTMEIFQKQKIRVVLQITSLELCAPDKVVGVMDAMNTLLSDQRAPFILILVVDPSIIVTCLENAGSLKGMADNGYLFLNRTVTLPFSVPALGKKTKLQLLKKAVQKTEDLIDWPCRNDANRGTKTGIAESMKLLREELSDDDEPEVRTPAYQPAYHIQDTFFALYNEREVLHEYIPDSICQMKRIVNAIPVMVHLMMLSKIPWNNISSRAVAAWVVLCNQWPCRLSWILQCLEDEEQQGSKEGFSNCLLWDVFKENSKELYSLKASLKNPLDMDGDPEIFQKFLSKDFPFTVEESRRLMKCTINLDFSIKNKMGLLRGINNLQNDWKSAENAVCETEKPVDNINKDETQAEVIILEKHCELNIDAEENQDDRTVQWKKANWFRAEICEDLETDSMIEMQEIVSACENEGHQCYVVELQENASSCKNKGHQCYVGEMQEKASACDNEVHQCYVGEMQEKASACDNEVHQCYVCEMQEKASACENEGHQCYVVEVQENASSCKNEGHQCYVGEMQEKASACDNEVHQCYVGEMQEKAAACDNEVHQCYVGEMQEKASACDNEVHQCYVGEMQEKASAWQYEGHQYYVGETQEKASACKKGGHQCYVAEVQEEVSACENEGHQCYVGEMQEKVPACDSEGHQCCVVAQLIKTPKGSIVEADCEESNAVHNIGANDCNIEDTNREFKTNMGIEDTECTMFQIQEKCVLECIEDYKPETPSRELEVVSKRDVESTREAESEI